MIRIKKHLQNIIHNWSVISSLLIMMNSIAMENKHVLSRDILSQNNFLLSHYNCNNVSCFILSLLSFIYFNAVYKWFYLLVKLCSYEILINTWVACFKTWITDKVFVITYNIKSFYYLLSLSFICIQSCCSFITYSTY